MTHLTHTMYRLKVLQKLWLNLYNFKLRAHFVFQITTCSTTENSLWVGHQSGRIMVLQMDKKLTKVTHSTELIGHYNPVIQIDLNTNFSSAISCSGENYVIVWDMNR